MDTKAAIIALLSVWGVGACATVPALALETEDRSNPLLNKVWVRSEADEARPGPMQIFLADGTLVSDSCWEAYRLSKWQQVSDTAISWDEDGMTINADIATLTDSELVLNLKLGGEIQEQRYVSATVPYVCPGIIT
ncbi:MAG TPA: hypothetical protein VF982_00200 [Anaerolineales bacterium]